MESSAFKIPTFDVVVLPLKSSLLDSFLRARLAEVVHFAQTVDGRKFGATGLPNERLSRATLLHVAPSPITTSVIDSVIVAHLVTIQITSAIERDYCVWFVVGPKVKTRSAVPRLC